MEDTAQDDDQSSAELADGEQSGSETDDDNSASEGDVLDDDGSAENEGSAGSSDEEEATDDLEEDTDGEGKPKVVPVSRLRKVIEERNDLREQTKIFKTLLQQEALKKEGGTKEDKDQVHADLSKYSPKQVAEAKALLKDVLAEDRGQMTELQQAVKRLSDENEAFKRAQFAQQDNAKLIATLKEFKATDGQPLFKRSEVEAQIQTWHKSGNPELQALAKAPYRTILREMKEMKDKKAAKKPKPAPRVPAEGGGGSDANRFRPNAPARNRPNPGDTSAWENNLAAKATEMMRGGNDE